MTKAQKRKGQRHEKKGAKAQRHRGTKWDF